MHGEPKNAWLKGTMSILHTVFDVAENAKTINEFIADMASSASEANTFRDASDGFCAMACIGLGMLSTVVLAAAIRLHGVVVGRRGVWWIRVAAFPFSVAVDVLAIVLLLPWISMGYALLMYHRWIPFAFGLLLSACVTVGLSILDFRESRSSWR